MATVPESGKAKIARRVIEVFEFFDTSKAASVMDIVRTYGRPQSSTSELLTNLVEMGFLYKDLHSRSYSPTPRLAALGTAAQPDILRDGRLFAFMDRLAASTRGTAVLFGIVGTDVQAFHASAGRPEAAWALARGASETLSRSTAGLLLLSTLGAEQAGRMLWRLNAEAPMDARFNLREMSERVAILRQQGHATGPAGFAGESQVTAVLLPHTGEERPLAIGLLYPATASVDADALVDTLNLGIAQCGLRDGHDPTAKTAAALVRAM